MARPKEETRKLMQAKAAELTGKSPDIFETWPQIFNYFAVVMGEVMDVHEEISDDEDVNVELCERILDRGIEMKHVPGLGACGVYHKAW